MCYGQTAENIYVLKVSIHVDKAETDVPTVHPFHELRNGKKNLKEN